MASAELQIWLDGEFSGTILGGPDPTSSHGAWMVLKSLGERAELRDPIRQDVYRYDPATDSVVKRTG